MHESSASVFGFPAASSDLAALLDWASRRVLSCCVSITLDSTSCIAAVKEAIARSGCPTIMNTIKGRNSPARR